jgi:multisubunit Na+/H+ antiporter MnhG subunit
MTANNPNPDSTEPALSVGAVAAAVGAVLALLISFGVDLTESQTKAILGVVLVAGPVALAAITRARVYAPGTVARLLRR